MDDISTPPYRTRLWVLFASQAHRAVVLRRGPRKHYRLSLWDTRTDDFTHGQWMRGTLTLCDLSPKGDMLLYAAQQYGRRIAWDHGMGLAPTESGLSYEPLHAKPARRPGRPKRPHRKVPRYLRTPTSAQAALNAQLRDNEGVWTAVSTPPYFSALAIWPSLGPWTGGGWFSGAHDIVIREAEDGLIPKLNVPWPRSIRVRGATREDGFRRHPSPFSATRPYDPNTPAAPWSMDAPLGETVTARLISEGARWVEWCHPEPNGDLLFACDGCIHRLTDWRGPDHAGLLREARCLADFRTMRFTRMAPPPEAMRWPR